MSRYLKWLAATAFASGIIISSASAAIVVVGDVTPDIVSSGGVAAGPVNVGLGGQILVDANGSPNGITELRAPRISLDGGRLNVFGDGTLGSARVVATDISVGPTPFVGFGGILDIRDGGQVIVDRVLTSNGDATINVIGGQLSATNNLFFSSTSFRGNDFATNILIDSGGRISTSANFGLAERATLTLNDGVLSASTVFVETGGLLTGNGGTVASNVVLDGGTIAPGNSPGTLTINGDLDVTSGILEFEFAGLNDGEFDILNILGNLTVSDTTTFSFSFIDGFTPQEGDTFSFLNIGGSNNLELAMFNVLTDGLLGDMGLDFAFSNGMFSATVLSASEVPIPGALPLMISGLAGMGWISRRKKCLA